MIRHLRSTLFTLLFLCFFTAATAQTTAVDTAFVCCDDSAIGMLDINARLDMIDLNASQMTARVTNGFEGYSTMTVRTPDHLRIQLTEVSTWDICRLRTTDGQERFLTIHCITAEGGEPTLTLWRRCRTEDADSLAEIDDWQAPSCSAAALAAIPDSIDVLTRKQWQRTLITAPVVFAIDMATRTLSATLYAERLPQGLRPYLTRRQWRWDGQRWTDIATKP